MIEPTLRIRPLAETDIDAIVTGRGGGHTHANVMRCRHLGVDYF
jgi:hypothetical protein